ncbi:MAG: PAS domain S-box protein [Methanomicrobiales archaeon]|nr:PAS domain S-box protein [Methanomicrobiales archaeon]
MKKWTIRTRMILLLIPAIIVVLAIATIFSLQLASVAQKDVAYDDTLTAARAYAQEFNTGMSDNLAKSRTFSMFLDQDTGMTRDGVLNVQHTLLRDNPEAIGIGVIFEPGAFDGHDAGYANTPGHTATGRFTSYWNRLNGTESLIPVVDIETSDWYTVPKRTQQEIVMEPLLYENVLMTSYITPIIKNGTFAGTVGIDVALERIDRTVGQVKVFDTGYAFLVSNTGIFVSSPKKEYIGRMSLDELSREKNNPDLAAMAADIRAGKEGYAGMADPFTGKNVVMFYSPIQTGNWSMVVVAPTDEMLAGMVQLGSFLLLIGLLSILVIGGIIFIVARDLSGPIVAMSRTADRIASGDLDVHVPEQDGELGVLANAFNNMAARLRVRTAEVEARVSELLATQAALHESEEKYRDLVDNSHDIIYTITAEGVFTFVSPAWTTLLGHPVSHVVGQPFQKFVHPDDLSGCMIFLQSAIGTGQRQGGIEYRVQHTDGTWHWHTTSAVPFKDDVGKTVGFYGIARDITERKVAEEALRKNTEELHAAYEELTATDEELRANVTDLTRQELTLRLSEDRLLMTQKIGQIGSWEYSFESGKIWGSGEALRIYGFPPTSGYHSLGDIEACVEDRERVHHAFVEFLNSKRDYDIEITINPRDGSSQRVVHSIARLETDAQANPLKVMGIIQDITERRRAEYTLQRVNQKLNVLSQLTRKDLTNHLFVLSSYLELTKNQLAGQDHIIDTLEKGNHAVRLIHETIEYSKDYQDMGEKPPKWQNVNMVLLFGLSHISFGEIQHHIETGSLEIFADPLLERACQRLFENSVKHGGHVTMVRVWHTVTHEGATIVFEDDGIGIPQEKKEQIFLRGDGTRASMKSLIFVREILDITGITIIETGEPGKGARFEMTVPKGAWRMAGTGTNDVYGNRP